MEKSAKLDDFGLDSSDPQPMNDDATQERLKKQSSYTYWVQNNMD